MHFTTYSVIAALAGSSEAFFRISCPGRVVRTRLDPIVSPGAVAGHVHTISGGAGFAPTMTYAGMRASKCSTCTVKEDMSNYWTPQLYVKFKNGTFTPVPEIGDPEDVTGGMTVYYLQRRGNDPNEKLHAFPEGFRMIAGDPFTRSFGNNSAAKAISYSCLSGPNLPETNNMPNYNCPGGLRAQVFFPSCWNGKDVDTPDHKSHMSYPVGQEYNNGACPPDFPIHMISLFYEVLYDTSRFLDQWNGDQHPFVFSNGDASGYGYHGDFINGWDIDVLQRAIDECNDPSGQVEKCPVLTQFTGQECQECRLPEQVDEVNNGLLQKLPGCNPVTGAGPRAVPQQCDDGVKLGIRQTNYVDLVPSRKWEYVGCGRDNIGDRALTGPSWSRDNTTVESCIDFCSAKGFPYAGLEYKGECFCGDKLNVNYAPKAGIMGACGMKCTGNQDQVCGGWAAMSVYRACPADGPCANNEEFGKAATTATVSTVTSTATFSKAASTSTVSKAASTTTFSKATLPATVSKAMSTVTASKAATATKVKRAAIASPVLMKKIRGHPREMVVA